LKSLIQQLVKRQISLRQALLALLHFFSPSRMRSGDDFNWKKYHLHYKEELKSISREATLILDPSDVDWVGGALRVRCQPQMMATHHALYESVSQLSPRSILEVGSGGGDHLVNLEMLLAKNRFSLQSLTGVDRSQEQIRLATSRHPELGANFLVGDVSDDQVQLPRADVVYSHAVLMHISERDGRFQRSLNRMVKSSSVGVVLQENWTQHEFLKAAKEAIRASGKLEWRVFSHESSLFPGIRTLVVAGPKTALPPVENYEVFLQGAKLRTH